MKHYVLLFLVTVYGCCAQSNPESPAVDLLPPFEEKPVEISPPSIEVFELLPPFENHQPSLERSTSEPATFQCFSSVCMPKQPKTTPKVVSSSSVEPNEEKPTTQKVPSSRVTEKSIVLTTQKPIEQRPKTVPETKRPFETISPKNYKNSGALPDGTYKFSYNLENGVQVQEQGSVRPGENSEFAGTSANGGYSYTAPDGQVISVQYVADEFGFRPVGSHIPAIPEPIARALKYLQSLKKSDEQQ
ncbi:larval cuticle protein LCP-22-like [Phlebotomus argentipes]|uniref:larval cuticle protein LCP-22-like n=1 Tax=Phlebotomus argentipes TaxID=94469 RepID=UPI002892D4F6|nr:larval cuticle protein LCP-22-like [Phlebotomus argentipes]